MGLPESGRACWTLDPEQIFEWESAMTMMRLFLPESSSSKATSFSIISWEKRPMYSTWLEECKYWNLATCSVIK